MSGKDEVYNKSLDWTSEMYQNSVEVFKNHQFEESGSEFSDQEFELEEVVEYDAPVSMWRSALSLYVNGEYLKDRETDREKVKIRGMSRIITYNFEVHLSYTLFGVGFKLQRLCRLDCLRLLD